MKDIIGLWSEVYDVHKGRFLEERMNRPFRENLCLICFFLAAMVLVLLLLKWIVPEWFWQWLFS